MPKSPVEALLDFGQSPWLDFIQRDLIRSGEFAKLQQRYGLRGVTSNPAIFEQAIGKTEHYDSDIREFGAELSNEEELYERLVLDDIAEAADIFRPVYDACDGADGFVSLEVSPRLANDTQGTVKEARRLWSALDRPNVMIKVPATKAGLPAIRQLIAEGINVNVTLLFALDRYAEVAEAYVAGLEDRAATGASLERVASVASFFVSRLDAVVDGQLGESSAPGAAELRGKAAIANARMAYLRFKDLFEGKRFAALAKQGARTQRLLWASTSTKDPKYSDVLYVETLIGPETVNTLPLATIEAYDDHGKPAARIEEGGDPAAVLASIATAGVDLKAVTDELLRDGVDKFAQAYDTLLAAIVRKRSEALGTQA